MMLVHVLPAPSLPPLQRLMTAGLVWCHKMLILPSLMAEALLMAGLVLVLVPLNSAAADALF